MRKSEIKIKVRLRDISNANYVGAWEKFCDKYGYNYYCMNEGFADDDLKVEISLNDAENWGLIDE
tara:strand:- start:7738 stop:7932 length:195 start_codon:yes stop_codon:yes gene_type:complete